MPPVVCYICGQNFGTRSIKIHIPNCEKKWDNEQSKLPKSQRRPPPSAPDQFDKVISGEIKGKELQRVNDQAFDDFNKKSLDPCENCGRTFLPKALEIHLRSCRPKTGAEQEAAARKKKSVVTSIPRKKRPGTYVVSNNSNGNGNRKANRDNDDDDDRSPTREDLIDLIRNAEAFDSKDARRDLLIHMKRLYIER